MKKLVLLFLSVSVILTLSTGIDAKKEACFSVESKYNSTLTITYVISGF
jgi:hypothetical protein